MVIMSFFYAHRIFISITVCSGNISLDTSFDTCHSGMVIKNTTDGKANIPYQIKATIYKNREIRHI
jgi:hypothetical protein